jgi:hypothetical protein
MRVVTSVSVAAQSSSKAAADRPLSGSATQVRVLIAGAIAG